MRVDYKLKPFLKSPILDKLDREKRNKVEETLNKKLTDWEWIQYKHMTIPKNKDGK